MISRRLLVFLLARPQLWSVALRQALRLSPDGWWKMTPFIPGPDSSLLEMRSIIAYGGDGSAIPSDKDIIIYLQWCRDVSRHIRN